MYPVEGACDNRESWFTGQGLSPEFACPSTKLVLHTAMPPNVRNDDAGHRPLEIALPFQTLAAAPIATQSQEFATHSP